MKILGHANIASLLIKNGAKIEEKDIEGFTALHWAVYTDHEDVAKILLDNGADIHNKNNRGQVPRDLAISLGEFYSMS